LNQGKGPEEYQFKRVVFGINLSPLQAQFVGQTQTEKYKDEQPLPAETVMKSTCMENSMDSVPNEIQGVEVCEPFDKLWTKGGMHARKWLSDSAKILEKILIEDRASEVHLHNDRLPLVKTLGVKWLPDEDVKGFELTKRNFREKIARLLIQLVS